MRVFGEEAQWPRQDLIGFCEEFDPPLVLAAYQCGVFPMPLLESAFSTEMGWWSPMRRGILPLDQVRVTRSLRKSVRRYRTSIDQAFHRVIRQCANPEREGAWITEEVRAVYSTLHEDGQAHSVEVWDAEGRLVGGLYGVSIGGLFAGESMFHDPEHGRDASKVALLRLVTELARGVAAEDLAERRLLDVQWQTPHLASMGVIEVPRTEYLQRLDRVLTAGPPDWKGSADA